MNKIISVHGSECGFKCKHSKICYHKNKIIYDSEFKADDFIESAKNNKEYTIYVSICNTEEFVKGLYLLENTDNVHLTMPYDSYDKRQFVCIGNDDRIQVTVTSIAEIVSVGNKIQKLFLIKDDETMKIAIDILNEAYISNIHFPIDQSYANEYILAKLIGGWKACADGTITIDSCLENFLVNGTCVYQDNYVDINYDGTYRKCPFKQNGIKITETDTIDSVINETDTVDCIYSRMLGGK